MTQEEMQEQVELLAKTLEETKTVLAQKDAAVAELNKKLEEAAKSKSGLNEEELKAIKAKAEKHDELDKKVKTLEGELTMTRLKAKYPEVDFSVVRAGTEAEMDEQASKISAMIQAAVAKVAPKGSGTGEGSKDPGFQWDGRGQGAAQLDKGKTDAAKQKLSDAMKTNDGKGILDACFDLQPKATSRLFDGVGK